MSRFVVVLLAVLMVVGLLAVLLERPLLRLLLGVEVLAELPERLLLWLMLGLATLRASTRGTAG